MKNKGLPIDYETRDISIDAIKSSSNEGKKVIQGFIPYGSKSEEMYGVKEVILPSAFTKSLQENKKLVCLINHDSSKVVGSVKNNTLRFNNTDEGLYFEVDLPNTTYGNDAFETINRGDVETISFGFSPVVSDVIAGIEYLREVKLYEISILVTFPAYEETTSIALTRSRFSKIKETRAIDLEAVSTILEKTEIDDNEKTILTDFINKIETIYNVRESKNTKEEAVDSEPLKDTQLEALKDFVALETLI